jgi:hypothetical protein
MRLHQVEAAARGGAGSMGEAPVAPGAPDMEGIAADDFAIRLCRIPVAGNQRDIGTAFTRDGGHGLVDKPFSAAKRVIALADERNFHELRAARSSSMAASTRLSGRVTRQSLILPPPQPSMPQGRHG